MRKSSIIRVLALVAALYCGALWAETTITYQGRLDAGGQPHNGTVGMVFELYDEVTDGTQQGPTLNRSVPVTGGLFQVELDFGAQSYESGRWLAITVNGQLLSPRQRITGAPFALRALDAVGDCPTLAPDDEMVPVGGVCIDKYEASIWDAPVGGNQINGNAPSDYCDPNGQDCDNIYARSVAGVIPARNITWFQAQQALANSGKRLPTSAEWQMAVRGTPDGAPCAVAGGTQNTGANADCVSDWGAFDMVGNAWEWVADWLPFSAGCPGWGDFAGFSSDDVMCLSGASDTATTPGVLVRGGSFVDGEGAGPFAVNGLRRPAASHFSQGFRGAR